VPGPQDDKSRQVFRAYSMQSKLALTKSPPQKAASTNLSMVPGRIRKSADPLHVLFVGRDELIHRL